MQKDKSPLSVNEIRKLEKKAKQFGLDERLLIENASGNLSWIIDELKLGKQVIALSGKGNNGADTLAAARKLLIKGYKVKAAIVAQDCLDKSLSREVVFQKSILKKLTKVKSFDSKNIAGLAKFLKQGDFIIDGLLGIGVRGEVSGFLCQAINIINKSKKKIVSCDIPSGLDPQTGLALNIAIKADYTITFIAPKIGFFLNNAKKFCGKIITTDIGL